VVSCSAKLVIFLFHAGVFTDELLLSFVEEPETNVVCLVERRRSNTNLQVSAERAHNVAVSVKNCDVKDGRDRLEPCLARVVNRVDDNRSAVGEHLARNCDDTNEIVVVVDDLHDDVSVVLLLLLHRQRSRGPRGPRLFH